MSSGGLLEGGTPKIPSRSPNPEPDDTDRFGEAVASSGDGTTALVSAPCEESGDYAVGEAYLFEQGTQSLISATKPRAVRSRAAA